MPRDKQTAPEKSSARRSDAGKPGAAEPAGRRERGPERRIGRDRRTTRVPEWGEGPAGARDGFVPPSEGAYHDDGAATEAPAQAASGGHAGRGPRATRRSDESIRDEVCTLLTDNADLDASGIEVDVEAGEVTLLGSVDSRDAKWLTEDLAGSISGVREVHNRLRIARH